MYNFSKPQAKDPYNFDLSKTATPAPSKKPQSAKDTKPKEQNKAAKLKGMEPKRLALKYDPPTISNYNNYATKVLEYLQASTGQLYHHKMKLLKLKPETPANHALDYLRKKHAMYFLNNKLPEKQLLELINKLIKRIAANTKPIGNTKPSVTNRPQTASTTTSISKDKGQGMKKQEIDDYGMSEEDMYNYVQKKNQLMKQKPILNEEDDEDDEDYQEDYDEEDEEEEQITEAQYKQIYQKMGYNNLNLNKMSNEELQKHKKIMESMYQKNTVKPGDPKYKYDVQKEFKPSVENEWDMEDEDDYDIV